MTARPSDRRSAVPAAESQRGVALVLALIFSILLYILVAELVVAGRMVRATGENDALLARMRTQMLYHLREAEDQLLDDQAGGAGGEGGDPGGLGGALGGGGAGGAGGLPGGGEGAGGEEEEEADPAGTCDSSRDAWYEPVGHADNDLTTYVWVEDENRKFNLLAIWSPDEKFAEFSRDRLVRLLDALREDTEFDVTSSDAQRIAQEIYDWGRRTGTDAMPRPRLKSDNEKQREVSAMVHLDDLLLLPAVTEDLFYDKVFDSKVYLGLESVLTTWTALRADPGDPEKVARQRAAAIARGETPPDQGGGAGANQPGGGAPAAGGNPAAGGAPAGGAPAGGAAAGGEDQPPPQPEGEGIRININTASRPVLRSILPADKIPDRVIDAIIKFRNEPDEKANEAEGQASGASGGSGGTDVSDFGNLQLGQQQKRKVFTTVADLEQLEEFEKLPDPELKASFQAAVTTKSEVFSIHLTSLFKRNEENRIYVLRRARSIVLRLADGDAGRIVPLVPFEERVGLRVQPIDLQEDAPDLSFVYSQMDQFAQEDRAWNPFYVDFFLPKHIREQFYRPQ